ncbi:UDP-N-acetylglucosamine 1-carboxyvinyltransferase, partial [Candidatus Acetothermia bacterium]
RAEVPLPGGCTIGPRPVDYHLQGLRALGAAVREEGDGTIVLTAEKLRGTRVRLPYPSVGATEQLLMAAALADGDTTIENASREPEVLDLVELLRGMGARIETSADGFNVEGVPALHGTEHTVIPDRLEAGTYLIAGAITRGRVTVADLRPEHLASLAQVLGEAGARVETSADAVTVEGGGRLQPVAVRTAPYPGFPTDLQPPLVSLLSLAEGESTVQDTVFPTRFGYVGELIRMGARIAVAGGTARITGVKGLHGADLVAPDIRAGAALVLAGLAARGESSIAGLDQLDRGYADLEGKLTRLGAKIERRDVQ